MASLADLQAWIQAHPTTVDAVLISLLWIATVVVVRYNGRFFNAVAR